MTLSLYSIYISCGFMLLFCETCELNFHESCPLSVDQLFAVIEQIILKVCTICMHDLCTVSFRSIISCTKLNNIQTECLYHSFEKIFCYIFVDIFSNLTRCIRLIVWGCKLFYKSLISILMHYNSFTVNLEIFTAVKIYEFLK